MLNRALLISNDATTPGGATDIPMVENVKDEAELAERLRCSTGPSP